MGSNVLHRSLGLGWLMDDSHRFPPGLGIPVALDGAVLEPPSASEDCSVRERSLPKVNESFWAETLFRQLSDRARAGPFVQCLPIALCSTSLPLASLGSGSTYRMALSFEVCCGPARLAPSSCPEGGHCSLPNSFLSKYREAELLATVFFVQVFCTWTDLHLLHVRSRWWRHSCFHVNSSLLVFSRFPFPWTTHVSRNLQRVLLSALAVALYWHALWEGTLIQPALGCEFHFRSLQAFYKTTQYCGIQLQEALVGSCPFFYQGYWSSGVGNCSELRHMYRSFM